MSKFLTFFPLGAISDQREYLGLSPDSENGTVINTLDQNIVFRLKLSNQQQIQSWTPKHKLSHKVVYDHQSQKYVGVFGNRHIRCWKQDDDQIISEKIKLPPIEEIISFNGKHTILVYKDGTCESLKNCSNARRSDWAAIRNEQTHQMMNIACFNTSDNNVMLTYFLRNKQTKDMDFVYFQLDHETLRQTGKIHKIKIVRDGVTLSAFTVVEGDVVPSVMTIWSDKRIFMLPIDEQIATDAGLFVTMFDCLKVDKPLSIVSVSKNCVAIYGGNMQQDGASLILYNTRYHVVQCQQFFKVHLNDCRLWVISKYILMAVGRQLTCAEFRLSQERLSDIIGSKRFIEFNGTVNKDSINEETELEECVSFNKEAQILTNGTTNRRAQHITKIQKTNQPTERLENFIDDLRSLYAHDIAVDIVKGDSLLSEVVQTRTVVHCKDQLYSVEEIASLAGELEKNGACESEITDRLVPLLIKAKLPTELVKCLRKYTNISDQMLAKSLKYFVTMEESPEKLTFINRVLACSFDEELIQKHLRTNLNLDNAIYILKHIHDALISDQLVLEQSPQYGDDFDCDTALVNWFLVILDAHYQQFILARDPSLNELIVEWKATIESFIQNIRDFKSMYAKLHHLVEGKAKPNQNPSSKWYSVEMVKLY